MITAMVAAVISPACSGGGSGGGNGEEPAPEPTPSPQPGPTPTEGPLALREVRFWAYQIQAVSDDGAVDALAASHYDMLVLEPTRTDWSSDDRSFDTQGMVERLQGSVASDGTHRKLVIAYVDIGEAEDWRWYWTWSTGWRPGRPKPADWPGYVLTQDPDGWEGDFPVAYWDTAWKDIMIYGQEREPTAERNYTSALDEVLLDGFDGIYLDWVEGYENEAVLAAAEGAGLDPAAEMIRFIGEIRSYARARDPDFLVIQQNAAALVDGRPEILSAIDAIAQEGVWFTGEASDDWGDSDGHDIRNDADLVSYYLDWLGRYLTADLPVFDCEYAVSQADEAYESSLAQGFIPYSTRTPLSRLTTTPPPGI